MRGEVWGGGGVRGKSEGRRCEGEGVRGGRVKGENVGEE